MIAMIARLPQPLKSLYLAWIVVFIGVLVSAGLAGQRTASLVAGVPGVVVALSGLTLVTNLNGAADALAEATKSYRPLGIDYSRSVLASPRYSRLFGAVALVVGAVFITQAATQL
jgi:hypothetical protein